jgi:L-cysteine desulfidase
LCEAALFSHLIAAIATDEIGAIGAWCGCGAKAGLAAAAAVAYLLGGNAAQVHQAINLIATESPGMLCDGAKPGCANKLGNARAVRRGVDAVRGHTTSDFNGIIFPDAMDTIRALGEICRTTAPTDVVIAKIIHGKWGRS